MMLNGRCTVHHDFLRSAVRRLLGVSFSHPTRVNSHKMVEHIFLVCDDERLKNIFHGPPQQKKDTPRIEKQF